MKKNLLWKEVKWETLQSYKDGIKYLQDQGGNIKAIVCNGKKGLLGLDFPLHMCVSYQR